MDSNLRKRLLIILLLIFGSIYCTFPLDKKINLGLDLKGGMHLILKVETEKLEDPKTKKDAVLRAIEVLRNRIDGLGVGETMIQQQGEDEILVQLPGITDRQAALNLVGTVAQLNFHIVYNNPTELTRATAGSVPAGYELKNIKEDKESILIEKEPALSGEYIADAHVNFDQMNQPLISISFNSEGSRMFGTLTQNNIGKRLAIVLDNTVISAPTIKDAIFGAGQITGNFTFEEASNLALSLRSGALPAPMHIEEERTIGPLLGKDSIDAGIRATLMAGVLLVIFMLYYLKAGIIADIALDMNLLLLFGTMGF